MSLTYEQFEEILLKRLEAETITKKLICQIYDCTYKYSQPSETECNYMKTFIETHIRPPKEE